MLALLLAASKSGGNNEVIVAAITAAATAFGSWLLFRGKKSQSTAEGIVEERKLLASEWGKFRDAVDKALENCRTENAELLVKIDANDAEIAKLKKEIGLLKRRNGSNGSG